jgi:hypothetical protein
LPLAARLAQVRAALKKFSRGMSVSVASATVKFPIMGFFGWQKDPAGRKSKRKIRNCWYWKQSARGRQESVGIEVRKREKTKREPNRPRSAHNNPYGSRAAPRCRLKVLAY